MEAPRRYICRTEVFGGLLHDRLLKNSIFISQEELKELESKGYANINGNTIRPQEVRMVRNACLPTDTFSAPDGIYFEITRACNLRCAHCFNSSGIGLASEWTWPDIAKLFGRFHEIGVLSVRFTGGEPFCSRHIFNALSLASDLGISTSIGTNGTLLPGKLVDRLSDSDVSMVIISIDGLRETNDKIRGASNFDKAVTGIRELIASGVKTRINVVATKETLRDIQGLIDLANELGTDIVIRRLINSGRAQPEQMLSVGDYIQLNTLIAENQKTSRVNIFSHYDVHQEKSSRISVPFYSSKCSCGTRGLGIAPNGDVFACGFLAPLGDAFRAGNIHEKDILDIWLNSSVLRQQRKSSMASFCRTGCSQKNFCKGSCPALLHAFNGQDPYCGKTDGRK